jgi:hypothetical protein
VFYPDFAGGATVPGKKHGPSIKKPSTYEALKKKGMSKSRAARISNAQASKKKSKEELTPHAP